MSSFAQTKSALSVVNVGPIVGNREVCVTIEGPGIEAVTSAEARVLAINVGARLGLGAAGFNKSSGAYPVTSDGRSSENVSDWKQIVNDPEHKYRNDIVVQSGLTF